MKKKRSRWIAVPVPWFDVKHDLHPHSRGAQACEGWAWIELIAMANWQDEGGLKRGQLRAAQRYLAHRWNWSRARVRRFLEKRETAGELRMAREPTHKAAREPTIITIVHYDRYQKPRPTNESTNESTNVPKDIKDVPAHSPSWGSSWKKIVALVPRPIASLQEADIKALPPAARDALDQLGGISALKQMSAFEFNRAEKRFPGLCREAASRGRERNGRSEREPPRREGNGLAQPEIDVAALQVVP